MFWSMSFDVCRSYFDEGCEYYNLLHLRHYQYHLQQQIIADLF